MLAQLSGTVYVSVGWNTTVVYVPAAIAPRHWFAVPDSMFGHFGRGVTAGPLGADDEAIGVGDGAIGVVAVAVATTAVLGDAALGVPVTTTPIGVGAAVNVGGCWVVAGDPPNDALGATEADGEHAAASTAIPTVMSATSRPCRADFMRSSLADAVVRRMKCTGRVSDTGQRAGEGEGKDG